MEGRIKAELRYMRHRAEQIHTQIEDIESRILRYDEDTQLRMRLALRALVQRRHALLVEIRRHELP